MSCINAIMNDVSRKTKRDENPVSVREPISVLRRDENVDVKVEATVKRPRLLRRVVYTPPVKMSAPTLVPATTPIDTTDMNSQYILMCEYSKKQYEEARRAMLDEVQEESDDNYGF